MTSVKDVYERTGIPIMNEAMTIGIQILAFSFMS